jgi:Rad3-related DNA helicase
VHLKRFFSEGSNGEYLFLIDEAHNLVERARSMYSASIYKEDFLAVKKIVKSHSEALVRSLKRCNDRMLSYKRQCETYEVLDEIMQLSTDLTRLYTNLDRLLTKQQQFEGRKEVLDFFFRLRSFLNIYEKLDENYEIYTEHTADGRFCLTLFCVDPSVNLQECLDYGRSAVFFSATLLPVDYYKKLLSTREDNYAIYAHTPFDSSRRLLLIGRDVSSKYTRRGASEYEKMARYIDAVVSAKAGNYLIFFPSYQMMQDVFSIYAKIQSEPVRCLLQQSHMTEEEREEFLQQFSENARPVVGFCVLGGIFSEGIDLKKESLIGAVIVGTGLPQIGNERDILKNHYERTMGAGFDYAFRYPGMNKVLQAAGRVIRTMDDVGVVVLLDERFLQSEYRRIFPREWESYRTCTLKEAPGMLADFWREYEKED